MPKTDKKKDRITMSNRNNATRIEKNYSILVADDNEANQKIAQLNLQKAGYRVDVVENGQKAVEACQQNHYDLILMDIQMPLMDGREATQRIRSWEKTLNAQSSELKFEKKLKNQDSNLNGKNSDSNSAFRIPTSDFKKVPILAMTGSATAASFDERHYPGMNGCIGKPLHRDLLLSAAQKWILAESKTQTNENPGGETRLKEKRSGENQLPLDLDRAIQEFMGEKEILYGVLQKFVISTGSQIDNIRQSVQGVDYVEIGSEAHAIKGAAANLTADKLAGLASDLEQAAKKQQPDLVTKLAGKLEREFFNLEKYIQQLPDV
jgi:CheY-like chemotaxis protein/HPt (histidine-containing phosphotransfer) domain-containing protein